jgi:hypothetical protein
MLEAEGIEPSVLKSLRAAVTATGEFFISQPRSPSVSPQKQPTQVITNTTQQEYYSVNSFYTLTLHSASGIGPEYVDTNTPPICARCKLLPTAGVCVSLYMWDHTQDRCGLQRQPSYSSRPSVMTIPLLRAHHPSEPLLSHLPSERSCTARLQRSDPTTTHLHLAIVIALTAS